VQHLGVAADLDQLSTDFDQSSTDSGQSSTDFGQSSTDFGQSSKGFGQSSTDLDQLPTDFGQSSTDFIQTAANFYQLRADAGESCLHLRTHGDKLLAHRHFEPVDTPLDAVDTPIESVNPVSHALECLRRLAIHARRAILASSPARASFAPFSCSTRPVVLHAEEPRDHVRSFRSARGTVF